MKPTLCSRCKKNLAVIFITKIDGGKTVNEGLCLKCAKEMGIKPVGYKGEGCIGCAMCFYNCPEPYAIKVVKA